MKQQPSKGRVPYKYTPLPKRAKGAVRPRMEITNIPALEDAREFKTVQGQTDLYNTLVNLVLNHKKELKKIPEAMHISTAKPWAEKRGLRAETHDLNQDGDPDVIVYDKSGNPLIINGYKPKNSDFYSRQMYMGAYPNKANRIVNPYGDYVNEVFYDYQAPAQPWGIGTVNKKGADNKYYKTAKALGYHVPARPKARTQPFALFTKLMAPTMREFWKTTYKYENVRYVWRKIISPLNLMRFLYIVLVDRPIFVTKILQLGKPTYEQWKAWKKANKDEYFGYVIGAMLQKDKIKFTVENIAQFLLQTTFAKFNNEAVLNILLGDYGWDAELTDEKYEAAEEAAAAGNDDSLREIKSVLQDAKESSNKECKAFFDKHISDFYVGDAEWEQMYQQAEFVQPVRADVQPASPKKKQLFKPKISEEGFLE